ncbi:MAG: membrane protein insertion efficiency factor YidD [Flavobacteriaceae bacterium]|nr:MAG: membrane protein insertion efficiency factor YidD [Flavobacteriaceae bacterium]
MVQISQFFSAFLIYGIKFYKLFLSRWFGQNCIYHPTCSTYSIQAIEKYGPIKGFWLSVKRIVSCHPFNKGGSDPVP